MAAWLKLSLLGASAPAGLVQVEIATTAVQRCFPSDFTGDAALSFWPRRTRQGRRPITALLQRGWPLPSSKPGTASGCVPARAPALDARARVLVQRPRSTRFPGEGS